MNLSRKGMMELLGSEWIVLNPYRDITGVWTIGAGHTGDVGGKEIGRLDELSLVQCMTLFKTTVQQYEKGVEEAFSVTLSQSEFDAAVSFHYNTGAISRAEWVAHVNNGNRERAECSSDSGIMAWRRPKQIIARRERERDLFFHGTYSGTGHISVFKANTQGEILWNSRKIVKEEDLFGNPVVTPAVPMFTDAQIRFITKTMQEART